MFFTIGKSKRVTNAQLNREADMTLELVSTQEEARPDIFDLQTMVHQRFRDMENRAATRRKPALMRAQGSDQAAGATKAAAQPLGVQGNLAAGKIAIRAILSAILAVAAILLLGSFLISSLA